MEPTFAIRPVTLDDAPECARLLTSLGHPTTTEAVIARFASWAAGDNAALVVPNGDGSLAGLATLHRMIVLHRPYPVGRIAALVVDDPWRGRGLGRGLVAAAERWLAERGCRDLEVTSHVHRVDAHMFYEHLGYAYTSRRFHKTLDPIR